mgnify:CR=1 FL=1
MLELCCSIGVSLLLQVPKPLPPKEVEEEEVMDLYEVNVAEVTWSSTYHRLFVIDWVCKVRKFMH